MGAGSVAWGRAPPPGHIAMSRRTQRRPQGDTVMRSWLGAEKGPNVDAG